MEKIFLYLDTGSDLFFSLFKERGEVIDTFHVEEKKMAMKVHFYLHHFLKKNMIKDINSLDSLYVAHGPGSYTGLRIAYGLSSILDYFGIGSSSFYYHHLLLELEYPCLFLTKAFKGEYFLAFSEEGVLREMLLKESEIKPFLDASQKKIFCLTESDKAFLQKSCFLVDEAELIRPFLFKVESWPKLLSKISSRNLLPPFYFREAELEFRVSPHGK